MGRLFISHSSRDNAQAAALREWLFAEGFDELFLDFDPQRGIVAGERWERALHDAADRCEAVIFLVSQAWLDSEWCKREFDLAMRLSKRIFGVLVEGLSPEDVPSHYTATWQFVNLAAGSDHRLFRVKVPPDDAEAHVTFSEAGLGRLKVGLLSAGLDPRYFIWPPADEPNREPYRGLVPLESQDAGIFFGREAPLVLAIDRLRDLHGKAAPRLFTILGASGSGKSSFLRAGLVPRLARDDRHFFPLSPLRPDQAAINGERGLREVLHAAFSRHKIPKSRAALSAAIEQPEHLKDLLCELVEQATVPSLPGETAALPPALVVSIDQAEELFQSDGLGEAEQLLRVLRQLLLSSEINIILVFTIRTDAYEKLQAAPTFEGLKQETFSLPPLPRGSYGQIIEGPAGRLAGTKRSLTIEPALTEALMADIESAGGRDALPLLAFMLQRLCLDYGSAGALRLSDYQASGGIVGSIEAAVKTALDAAAADPSVPRERHAQLALLRRGLIPWLAGIDPTTNEPRRKTARLSEIPVEAQPLIRHLIDARLLSTDVSADTGEVIVEPAHEALLRQWGIMRGWLAEDGGLLSALEGVEAATRDWLANGQQKGWLAHQAGRLEDAEGLFARPDLAGRLGKSEHDYLSACRQAEDDRRGRELQDAKRIARGGRRLLWGAVASMTLLAGLAGATWIQWQDARQQRDEALIAQSRFLIDRATQLLEQGDAGTAMLLALEAAPGPHQETDRPYVAGLHLVLQQAYDELRELIVLQGHEGRVSFAEFSPDGSQVLTASEDGTARLWDSETGEEQRVLEGHEGPVYFAVLSPDGSRVLTASEDGTARLWDSETGEERRVLDGHERELTSAVFSPDGRWILTATADWRRLLDPRVLGSLMQQPIFDDGTTRLWDADSGEEKSVLRWDEELVWLAKFSPDGNRVLTASMYGTARIWDAEIGEEQRVLEGHEGAVSSAEFSPDGSRVLTASVDGTARLWDAETGEEQRVLRGHEGRVSSAEFSPDGSRVLTASADGTARLWDAETGEEQRILRGHEGAVSSAEFSPDGSRVLTASEDGTARLWDAETGEEQRILRGHEGRVSYAEFSPNGSRVLTVSEDGTARLWDAEIHKEKDILLEGHERPVSFVEFSPGGSRVLTASADGTARLWDAETGEEQRMLEGHEGPVSSAKFSPDGSRVLTASEDGTARLWDAETGEEQRILRGHEGRVSYAEFSPDGSRVRTASEDGTARLWDAETGNQQSVLSVYPRHLATVRRIVFSPDGRRILTASDNSLFRIWDLETGFSAIVGSLGDRGWDRREILPQHPKNIYNAEFSPDGSRALISSAKDHLAYVFDPEFDPDRDEFESVLRAPETEGFTSSSFSPDGKRVLTVSNFSILRIWDAKTGEEQVKLQRDGEIFFHVEFSPDGRRVLTLSGVHMRELVLSSLLMQGTASMMQESLAEKGWVSMLRLWDAETGEEQSILPSYKEGAAAFSPDSSRVAITTADSTVRLLRVGKDFEALIAATRDRVPRCLSAAQRDAYFLSTEIPSWCKDKTLIAVTPAMSSR